MRTFVVSIVVVVVVGLAQTAHAQYRLSLNPGVQLPLRDFAGIVNPINPAMTFSIYRYSRQSPISLGTTFGYQYYYTQKERLGRDYTYELQALPLLLGFRYDLLPEFFMKPYYGAEAGVLFFRYRLYDPAKTVSIASGIAISVIPTAGVRFDVTDDLIVDFNVRYQLSFHDPIKYGLTEDTKFQSFSTLGLAVGFSYAISGSAR